MRQTVACLVGVVVALGLSPNAFAAATLMTGLGGPEGYGTSCMPPNDDGTWPADPVNGLDITPAFPGGIHFYSGTYATTWINNNGNISFQGPISTYTPDAFPGAPQPMIAPYWADVDTRNATFCEANGYDDGGGYPTGAVCMNPATNGVWWSITPGQFVVTWDQVGFFECNVTPVMSFQMILTSAASCGSTTGDGGSTGIDFNIEFRYASCGWEAGDASGGTAGFCPPGSVGTGDCTPAQAGFDSAEMPDMDFASLPMSRMSGISTELCTGSNLMPPQPGIWQFLVRGGNILCPTAGQACMTGMPGICAQGQLDCTATGGTTCKPLASPGPMQCNGLDNNCDGMIDDGPCPAGEVCDGTECVAQCNEGTCPAGQTCTAKGVCVETDCVSVMCPSGQRCVGGNCVDSCTGVTCPIGQLCRLGSCIDPCEGLTCGMGAVCEDGNCVPTCPCKVCTSAQTCETSGPMSGHCVETDCAMMTCPGGEVCQGGACVDACKGAVCPMGQTCQTGMCIANLMPDAGADSGGGLIMPGSDAGPGADAAGESGDFGNDHVKAGCGCRVTESRGGPSWAIGLGAGLAALFARGRRRRRLTRAGQRRLG